MDAPANIQDTLEAVRARCRQKWALLEALHEQVNTHGTPQQSLQDVLQAELLLRVGREQHATGALLEYLPSPVSTTLDDTTREMIAQHQQLVQTNAVLEQSIAECQQQIELLNETNRCQRDVLDLLKSERVGVDRALGEDDTPILSERRLTSQEGKALLEHVCKIIEKQKGLGSKELLVETISRLLQPRLDEDDDNIDIPVQELDGIVLKLLDQCGVIECTHDRLMVRLIDYRD